ncbi:unnamed protein product [Sordaria macrospora k-hell]|uniref:Homoaconitase, mitochondrial n=1 Tax=Sordaria macrospora (strain ATCC MYA-333 / DSM 997 / K(L3346) / K-hell) TaxID=771870 RepID=F7W2Q3_SORMK|nr:uncharacterized protein SMAC_05116 [Sordaria macrospora k-hell]CCC11904.1 unnamed protein product [Sordaria macrospora k-hell]
MIHPVRRALAVAASRAPRLLSTASRTTSVRSVRAAAGGSYYSTTSRRLQDAFPSQLENLASSTLPKVVPSVPQTLTEKIVQRYSVGLAPGKKVKSGDYVTLQPHHCMTHDNSWPVAMKFMSIGASKIHDNRQVVMTLDHDVQNKSEANLKKYRQIEEFAKTHGVDFYPAGRGIGHQIMVEEGYAWPGTVTVASDSHSNMYGGVGCLGTPMVRTDAASIWATGKTWWQIPPIAKVTFTGLLPPGVTGKDVIVALCGLFNNDDVLNHAIEFTGSEETMRSIPVDDRLTIANMTTEWGALSGLFPIDNVLTSWMRAKATVNAMEHPELGDKAKSPHPLRISKAQNLKLDKAYLVSCTNSRASDIAAAARVFKEAAFNNKGVIPKVAEGVKFYIAAASLLEQKQAEDSGDWQVLLDAGAEPLPSGCGPCIGLGTGLLEPGEIGISASNRNFKGRMGSTDAKAYLASPEIVAASALKGKIAGPGWYQKPEGVEKVIIGEGNGIVEQDKAMSIEDALDKIIAEAESLIAAAEAETTTTESTSTPEGEESLTEILPGFPEKISGEIIFCDADNINTDGIYPGKYTYQDNITPSKMAEVCMENYDPSFGSIAKAGDILVTGFNFGCGSSREQAATAILAKQIPLVVSGSFGNIFSRNSINNALMGVEVPKLVQRLREEFGEKTLTRRTGWKLTWDVRRSKVVVEEANGKKWEQKVGELPPNVQEIIARGGLEKWVKSQIEA